MAWYDWFGSWFDRTSPDKPQLRSITREQIMKFRYKFTLAEPKEAVTRKATVVVNGVTEEIEVENSILTQDFEEGSTVSVSFTDTDSNGNESDPTNVLNELVITDNVPPMPPTVTLAVSQLGESDDSSDNDEAGEGESEPPTPPTA